MDDLPNRKDPIYVKLEEIKDSELTNRIAYEMAIRNREVIELKNDIRKLIDKIQLDLLSLICKEPEIFDDMKLLNELYKYKFIFYKDDVIPKLYEAFNNGYLLPSFKKFIEEQEEMELIKEKNKILLEKYWIREYYEEDLIEYVFSDNEFVYHVSEPYDNWSSHYSIGKTRIFLTKFHRELGIINSEDSLFPQSENIEDYTKSYNKNISYNIYAISENKKIKKEVNLENLDLFVSTKRLMLPKKLDPSINILINPYLINDTEEHFKMILEAMKKNESIVRVSKEIDFLENFIKEYEKYNKELTKKTKKEITQKITANMFFVYDFYISLQEKISIINSKIKSDNIKIKQDNDNDIKIQEIRREIKQIRNQPTSSYSKPNIKFLEKELSEEEIPLKKLLKKPTKGKKSDNYIFERKDFKEHSNNTISSSTAYDYYYALKPHIEQLKYKELLSGLKL